MALSIDHQSRRPAGLVWAKPRPNGAWVPQRRRARDAGKKAGIRYQRSAFGAIRQVWPQATFEPWFDYSDELGVWFCQPDATVDLGDRVLVIEVKVLHSLAAWNQLVHLYGPVVAAATGKPTVLVEMTRTYDPATKWPERPAALMFSEAEVHTWLASIRADRPRAPGVWQWRP